ncbi:hypothetical protein BRADI_2g03385v3 [Brachypodium distachyon]|uniref:Uncharacterized protein n=1 Tax=Brachypodium distachyon TaxID=15368 RepID=A0A0Q3FX04_BRADI|nr:hypothetical protein BRADI_2g03385v3 [Brachypodium distachyon]
MGQPQEVCCLRPSVSEQEHIAVLFPHEHGEPQRLSWASSTVPANPPTILIILDAENACLMVCPDWDVQGRLMFQVQPSSNTNTVISCEASRTEELGLALFIAGERIRDPFYSC